VRRSRLYYLRDLQGKAARITHEEGPGDSGAAPPAPPAATPPPPAPAT
jgi:large subunit ribosomal protein L19